MSKSPPPLTKTPTQWRKPVVTLISSFLIIGCATCANAGECVALPVDEPVNSKLPGGLANLDATLIFEETFDAQADFSNPTDSFYCQIGSGDGCDVLPSGWSDFNVSERFHPNELNDSSLEPNFQINGLRPRGASGKSMVLWDESYGDPGQWGSDVTLAKKLDVGYNDLYVEMWMKFQPGYRWHLVEEGHGQNLAKILRIGHREDGKQGLSFGPQYFNGPMAFIDAMVWSTSSSGTNRAVLQAQLRCDPQESNYYCPGYSANVQGFLNNQGSFVETYGDGNWHKIAARMKLNSSPGTKDGTIMLFFDDVLVAEAHDIPWREAGSPADTLLNSIIIGGNMHNYPEPEANRFEQWYAIDDIKVYAID